MSQDTILTLRDGLSALTKAKTSGAFSKYIDYIRFPYFKNLEVNTRINFDFPITALVGGNGCGKSSVLQALFGAPEGYSTGVFWFSTSLDPIDESQERNCFIYGYKSTSAAACEVIKTRIKYNKKGGLVQNPDYWEPSRPIKRHGMDILADGKRHPAISMDVVQIDFRFQLSAFDRFFYLEEIQPWYRVKRSSKQDVLRAKAPFVQKALEGSGTYGANKCDSVYLMSAEELSVLQSILGKRYNTGKILRHKFYKEWAHSVQFGTDCLNYSEANAGSGEVAVALMVRKLNEAKPKSLVLLDEPEYSLHPAAQKNLLRYLVTQALRKQLQIVFTTHSPSMIEGLPRESIKSFEPLHTGRFGVFEGRLAEEAFVSLGHTITSRILLRVEDALAKVLVEEVVDRLFPNLRSLVEVQYSPGGTGRMKDDIVVYALEDPNSHLVLFDGDQFLHSAVDVNDLTTNQRSAEKLQNTIFSQTGARVRFTPDGGSSGKRHDQEVGMMETYLKFWHGNVFFFPFQKVEETVWNSELAKNELDAILNSKESSLLINKIEELKPKDRFAELARALFRDVNSRDILKLQTLFVKNWIKRAPPEFDALCQLVKSLRDRVEVLHSKT